MATSFEVIFLGTLPLIDTTQGDEDMENPEAILGTYGSSSAPLSAQIRNLTADRLSEDDNASYDIDNNGGYDSFRINGGAAQNFDGWATYNALITYSDGSTATITAVVMQDVSGNTYLVPEQTANSDQAALTARPIMSLTLQSVAANGGDLIADRVAGDFKAVVDGTSGNDSMGLGYTDGQGDQITNTNDDILAGAGNDTVFAAGGNDLINGGDGNDSIDGGDGNDRALGGLGNDTLLGSAGNDTLEGQGGNDALFGGAGADQLSGDIGDDTLDGAGGTDTVTGGDGADSLYGGSNADQIFGGAGADALIGGDGNDSLFGGTEGDTLDGGGGNDTLDGGDGNDLLRGDGQRNANAVANGSFETGRSADGTNSLDAVLEGWQSNTPGNLIESWGQGFSGVNAADGRGFIELDRDANRVDAVWQDIETESGSTYTLSVDARNRPGSNDSFQIVVNGTVVGTVNPTQSFGTFTFGFTATGATTRIEFRELSGQNNGSGVLLDRVVVQQGGGADSLVSGAGNDTLDGGIGNDTLDGGADADTVIGSAGDDSIQGGDGNDRIFGDSATPTPVTVTNGTFAGNSAAGWTTTGAGTTVYSEAMGFNAGNAGFGGTAQQTVATEVGFTYQLSFNTFELGTGSGDHTLVAEVLDASGQVIGTRTIVVTNGSNQVITIDFTATSTATTLRFSNPTSTATTSTDVMIDNVTVTPAPIAATTGNDTINAGEGSDFVDAGSGDDFVIVDGTFSGNDTLDGGAGTDALLLLPTDNRNLTVDMAAGTVSDGQPGSQQFSNFENLATGGGNDSVTGNSGANLIVTQGGNDTVRSGDGNDTVQSGDGDDDINAGDGNDVIFGGNGNDTIDDGNGADIVLAGAGDDVANTNAGNDTINLEDGNDTVNVWDIAGTDSLFGGTGTDVLNFSNGQSSSGASVTFSGNGAGSFSHFGGATTGTFSEFESVSGTANADTLNASATTSGVTLDGEAGNDTLTGGSGNDLLIGGAGNDTLDGGAGTDRAIFTGPVTEYSFDYAPGGALIVTDTVANRDGTDTLTGVEFATFNGVTYRVISGDDGSNTTLQGPNDGTPSLIIAHDGNDWGGGHATSDVVFGGAGDDTLDGGDGNDTLVGEGDNDLLRGDGGNDSLIGGTGNDTLQGGTGNDTLDGGAGTDRAIFTGPVTDYSFDYAPGGALIVTDTVANRDGTDTLTGVEFATFNGVTYRVIRGDDGSNTTLQGPNDGTPSLIIAHDGNDWGGGHATSDVVFGGAGDDTLDGGDGNDTLVGEGDNDLLRGDGGNDSLIGGTGNDTLQGGAGNDTLDGGAGADVLDGGIGNDSLTAGTGDDTLTSGTGDDTLTTGDGADVLILTVAGGADRITDFDMTRVNGRTVDQIDVSDLTNANGDPIRWRDVTVTDTVGDGSGDAVLTFANGESIILEGVTVAEAQGRANLIAIGIPCFVTGTLICTPQGWTPVEDLAPGALVVTTEGLQRVRWAGRRNLSRDDLARQPDQRPIHFPAGAIGNTVPLRLSPQHAVLMRARDGAPVLVRAKHLAEIGFAGARVAQGVREVCYHHILLERHAVVCAAGAATESFYPGPLAVEMLDWPSRLSLMAAIGGGDTLARPLAADALARSYGPRIHPLATRKGLSGLSVLPFAEPAQCDRRTSA